MDRTRSWYPGTNVNFPLQILVLNVRSKSVPDLTTGSVGVTIAFGCLVIMHGAALRLLRTNTRDVLWFEVHGKFLGWDIGEGAAASRYNILLMPIADASSKRQNHMIVAIFLTY